MAKKKIIQIGILAILGFIAYVLYKNWYTINLRVKSGHWDIIQIHAEGRGAWQLNPSEIPPDKWWWNGWLIQIFCKLALRSHT